MTPRRPDPRFFAVAVAIAFALAGCTKASVAEPEAPRAVRCAAVETGSAAEERTVRGPLRPPPDRDAPVSSRVPGTILSIPVREGDAVKKGTVLATLDDRLLGDERRRAEHAVEQARAAATAADANAARKARLLEHGITARADSEAAAAEAAKARADLGSAEAALDAARAEFDQTKLTSPIAGFVVRVFKQVGESVDGNPGQPVVEVADPSRLELRAEVPVADLRLLRSGQPVRLTVDGVDEPIDAKVASVSPGVSSETGLGVVRIALPEKVEIPVGAMATAHVLVKMHAGAALIPAAALRGGADGTLEAVVCDGEKARIAAVKAGVRTGDGRVEILSGLRAGESVVADGGLGLDDGAAIEVQKAATDTGDATPVAEDGAK